MNKPVAYWIPKTEQFCIAKDGDRPFAKAWEPLYSHPSAHNAPAFIYNAQSGQDEISRLRRALLQIANGAPGPRVVAKAALET